MLTKSHSSATGALAEALVIEFTGDKVLPSPVPAGLLVSLACAAALPEAHYFVTDENNDYDLYEALEDHHHQQQSLVIATTYDPEFSGTTVSSYSTEYGPALRIMAGDSGPGAPAGSAIYVVREIGGTWLG
jgi:hypothetical protein